MGDPSPTEAQCEETLGLYECTGIETYACNPVTYSGLCFYQLHGAPWCTYVGVPGWFPVCSSYALAFNTCEEL